jgi:hypothetical protein
LNLSENGILPSLFKEEAVLFRRQWLPHYFSMEARDTMNTEIKIILVR